MCFPLIIHSFKYSFTATFSNRTGPRSTAQSNFSLKKKKIDTQLTWRFNESYINSLRLQRTYASYSQTAVSRPGKDGEEITRANG